MVVFLCYSILKCYTENEISFRFGINSVPTQWLVDKKGILRETNARFNLEASVERLLKEE